MKLVNIRDSDCRKILALLEHFLSHELTAESSLEVVKHLESCPKCLKEFKSREKVKKCLRESIVDETGPPALRKRILRLIRKENSSWFSRTFGSQKVF